MQRFKAIVCIIWPLLLFMASTDALAAGNMVPTSDDTDISEHLNQKLTQYDKSRSNLRSPDNKFSLNYSKNYGTMSRPGVAQNPMAEQQNRLNAFKSVKKGPRSSEDFYGFSMRIPLDQK